jgi:succinoglycan biosynthesis transport protein ExoP
MDRHYESSTHSNSGAALHPADFVRLLRTHIRWWAVPAVAFAVLAGAYSLVAPREWRATQALIVRPEAASVSEERPGKFADLSEMKTLQETILELAKSKSVIEATLRELGPSSRSAQSAQWPSELDVQGLRDDIDMRPPGGAEFGKTEIFYLSVRNSDRDRAGVLATALCKQLEGRMQELRDQRAQSMMAELQRTVSMADGDLASQIGRLSAFEANVGADLADLRSLNAETGGQGQISQELQGIETERRANESHLRENERLLKLLVAAKGDPQQLLATPNSLLVSQPAVSQLKNALVSAQVHTANLLGSRAEAHPYVIAAREAESLIRSQLNNEVAVAIRGLQVEIELSADREKSLAAKYASARERMSHLAEGRAEYSNLVASVQNHTRLVEAARKNMADARARQASAHSASMISRIDGVEAGVWPSGPTRKTITAAGGVGGLLLGFGFVFLFATPSRTENVAEAVVATEKVDAAIVEPVAKPIVVSSRSSSENFGMFRGKSLQEAVRSIQERSRSEV